MLPAIVLIEKPISSSHIPYRNDGEDPISFPQGHDLTFQLWFVVEDDGVSPVDESDNNKSLPYKKPCCWLALWWIWSVHDRNLLEYIQCSRYSANQVKSLLACCILPTRIAVLQMMCTRSAGDDFSNSQNSSIASCNEFKPPLAGT